MRYAITQATTQTESVASYDGVTNHLRKESSAATQIPYPSHYHVVKCTNGH